jgi:hypothetical protein
MTKTTKETGSALSREIKRDASRFDVPTEKQIKAIPTWKQRYFFNGKAEWVGPKRTIK